MRSFVLVIGYFTAVVPLGNVTVAFDVVPVLFL